MHIPVLCHSCGSPIGDVAHEYLAMLKERVAEFQSKTGILATKMADDPSIQIDVEDILDKLWVDADCCRMHLVTTIDFRDYN